MSLKHFSADLMTLQVLAKRLAKTQADEAGLFLG